MLPLSPIGLPGSGVFFMGLIGLTGAGTLAKTCPPVASKTPRTSSRVESFQNRWNSMILPPEWNDNTVRSQHGLYTTSEWFRKAPLGPAAGHPSRRVVCCAGHAPQHDGVSMPLEPHEAWRFLLIGYLFTVAIETPVLLVGLSKGHRLRDRLLAGIWLNACSYPIVVLVFPYVVWAPFGRVAYLAVAEILRRWPNAPSFGLCSAVLRSVSRKACTRTSRPLWLPIWPRSFLVSGGFEGRDEPLSIHRPSPLRGRIGPPILNRLSIEETSNMTMDKSLRVRAGMARARNVLTRDERIARLQAADRWQEDSSPFGLAKVRVYKLAMKKKKKKKKEDEEGEGAADTAAKTPAKGAKPAAKPAAKAAGKK